MSPKVALVHDYLNQQGGAERVLEVLLDMFPQAHVYTLLYSKSRTDGRFHKNIHKTSLLDFGLARRYHRLFIPFMPLATRSLRLRDNYDLIISDSAGYAKGIQHSSSTFHLSYCYTPLRYAWEIDNYFANPIFKTIFRPTFNYLKRWDYRAAQKPNVMLAVSRFIAGKIRNYYGRNAPVLYPPVDYRRFYYDARLQSTNGSPPYYLGVGRLLHYKKFDLLVDAFRELSRTLLIVGTGPEGETIRQRTARSSNIRYIPFVSDTELHALYGRAKGLIFPQVEDFGLVAAEAQACGTPVIALAKGGAPEIVIEGVTGVLFREQTVQGIIEAVRRLEEIHLDRKAINSLSQRFSIESFKRGLLSNIPQELLNR